MPITSSRSRLGTRDGTAPAALTLPDLLEAGGAALQAGRWHQAVEAFRGVLRLAPDLGEVHAALGSALLVLGRAGEAIPALAEAARILDDSEAWNNMGWACSVGQRHEEARAAFVKAIERDPENLDPQRNLAALFELLGMLPEAGAAYALILLTAPADREALAGRARCARTGAVQETRPVAILAA